MSRKQAIDQMCKQCIYDGSAGGGSWRKQAEDCPSDGIKTKHICPLWDYRPVTLESSRAKAAANRENKIECKDVTDASE